MKKRLVFIPLAIFATIGLCSFTDSTSEEVGASTTPSSSSTSISKLEDIDGNGIPDAIEDYYNKAIKDQYMFGISLGSIIGLATSIISNIYIISKNTKSNKGLKGTVDGQAKVLADIEAKYAENNKILEEYREQLNASYEHDKQLVEQLKVITDNNLKSIQNSSAVLAQYSQFEGKLNALVYSTKAISGYSALVSEGISTQVNEIINGVE